MTNEYTVILEVDAPFKPTYTSLCVEASDAYHAAIAAVLSVARRDRGDPNNYTFVAAIPGEVTVDLFAQERI